VVATSSDPVVYEVTTSISNPTDRQERGGGDNVREGIGRTRGRRVSVGLAIICDPVQDSSVDLVSIGWRFTGPPRIVRPEPPTRLAEADEPALRVRL
jgi:hypothetical protein